MKGDVESTKTWNLNKTVQDFVDSWIMEGLIPQSAMEGVTPDFAGYFEKIPDDMSFDAFRHQKIFSGWSFHPLKFQSFSGAQFYFYVPDAWSRLIAQENLGNILEEDTLRQTIFILPIEEWYASFRKFLSNYKMLGFTYNVLYGNQFVRWLFILQDPQSGEFLLFGVYSSGQYVVMVKAMARDRSVLEQQIVSLINTSPWDGWIQDSFKVKN